MKPWIRTIGLLCLVFSVLGCERKPQDTAPQAAIPAAPATLEPLLTLAILPDYLPENLVPDFERETGWKVKVDHFESYEALNAKLVVGHTGYDLVVTASAFAAAQVQAGMFQPLDRKQLPGLANLDPLVQGMLTQADPNNRHLVPWAWGYTAVGINRERVSKALGDLPWPEDSWRLIFDPLYTKRLSRCGLAMLDAPTEVLPAALHYLGFDPLQPKPQDIEAALAQLKKVQPHVRYFNTMLIDDFAAGKICAALAWGGDMRMAAQRAKDEGQPQTIEVLIPPSGGLLFVDTMAIPADAPRVAQAHRFIDFYLRPENAAAQTNQMGYLTGNAAALPKIDPTIRADAHLFLDETTFSRMVPPLSFNNQARAALADAYTRFRAGR